MALGLIGIKNGMTHVFTDKGVVVPVTVIEIQPNRISQLKTVENDGYTAVQVAAVKKSSVNKPRAGHLAKANIEASACLREFRVNENDLADKNIGDEISIDYFKVGDAVDVIGTSIGKGYAGAVKRHHFRTQDMTHGNSLSHRAPGSIGQNQSPGRVFKGKRMSGHLGNVRRTAINQEVVRVDAEKRFILIKGAVPGHKGSIVVLKKSVKCKGGK